MEAKQTKPLKVLPTATHKDTKTRHIVTDEYANPVCGANALKLEWDVSPMLGEFPEDFGNLDVDCKDCARHYDAGEYTTVVDAEDWK